MNKQSSETAETPDTSEMSDRRPLTSRETGWARSMAAYLSATSVTPNQISAGSVVAALLALLALWCSTLLNGWVQAGLYLIAAIGCQLRLVCNLMDGMVAIEAGKQTPDGAVWNELPDRIADILILAGVGVAAGTPLLGWVAATLAVFVAYVRELGKGIDGVVDFKGPMAKQHRMALVTIACILAVVLAVLPPESFERHTLIAHVFVVALWLCIVGCVITLYRRTQFILARLQ